MLESYLKKLESYVDNLFVRLLNGAFDMLVE